MKYSFSILFIILFFACMENNEDKAKLGTKVEIDEKGAPRIGILYLRESTIEIWENNRGENFQLFKSFQIDITSTFTPGRYIIDQANQPWTLKPMDSGYPFERAQEFNVNPANQEGFSFLEPSNLEFFKTINQFWILSIKPESQNQANSSFGATPRQVAQQFFLQQALEQRSSQQYTFEK